ncbi:MAG: hypothetical protein RLZZ450_7045, partial [Pseudomonadota bacterium]
MASSVLVLVLEVSKVCRPYGAAAGSAGAGTASGLASGAAVGRGSVFVSA